MVSRAVFKLTERIISAANWLSRAVKNKYMYQFLGYVCKYDRPSLPGIRAYANDSDRATGYTDFGGDVRDVDTQKTQKGADSRRGGGLKTVAAVEGPSGALSTTHWGGDRKSG